MTDAPKRLARAVRPRIATPPVRYATVISRTPSAGTVVVRPTNALATDGSEDVTASCLMPVVPAVGALVRIDVYQGDVLVLGAPALDTYPGIPYAMAAGTATVVVTAANNGNVDITYPTGRFSTGPIISVQKVTALGAATKLIPMVTANSSTGATLAVYTGDGTTTTATFALHWTAVQMLSTAAAG